MAVYRDIDNLQISPSVVTIGSFDGVHLGHRVLLQHVTDIAQQHACRSVVITFWPHPKQVVYPQEEPQGLLNTLEEKIALLTQVGVDDIVVFPFDKALSQMTAPDFVSSVLVKKLQACYLVVGKDHHFGKNRSGDAANLQDLTNHYNLQVEIVDLKMTDRKISSSAIRNALIHGKLQQVNEMLGYYYTISGEVIQGNQLGRTIAFPTANIALPEGKLLPKEGVYRTKVDIEGQPYLGMLYIGKRPVLKQPGEKQHIEVNIFDFDQQIYGKQVTIHLTHFIRDDIKFDNMEQLAMQLQRDKQNVLDIGD